MQAVRLKIPYPVVVEGKYDKIRLLSVIDANIIVTDGFGVFNNKELRVLLRLLCEKGPVIVATDSDGGGRVIRGHLKGVLPPEKIINVYIPPVKGKEKRKKAPSKEGLVGLEGMENAVLRELFSPFEGEIIKDPAPVTKAELYALGFMGRENSASLRKSLCHRLRLPENMSSNALLEALTVLYTGEEIRGHLACVKGEINDI